MVQQVDFDLSAPLLTDAEPSITVIPLEPALATAALTLHGDFYRQLQSKTNHRIFWHPVTQTISISVLVSFFIYKYSELIEISDSFAEFLHLCWSNKYLLTTFFPVFIFLAGSIGLTSFIISDEFRFISDSLKDDAVMLKIFRFPLRIYASYDTNDKSGKSLGFIDAASSSTDFIKYRDSPIAIVTVVPLPDKSTSDVFYAKITGLHVRKVYEKTGLQNELLDLAKIKAKNLCSRYVKDMDIKTKSMRIVLTIDGYSLNTDLNRIIKDHDFKLVETTTNVNPFFDRSNEKFLHVIPVCTLMNALGITRLVFECEIEGSIENAEKKKSSTTVRQRKHK